MKKVKFRFLSSVTALFLAASSAQAITHYSPVAGIQFDASIPKDQYDLISRDLAELQKIDLTASTPGLAALLGTQDVTSVSLLKWVTQRVHYVVSEDFDPDAQTVSIRPFHHFPYPDTFPDKSSISYSDTEANDVGRSDSGTSTVMANLGIGLYVGSKRNHFIRTIAIPGLENVSITSARVGILRIGRGLFDKNIAGLGSESSQSKARRAYQLGVLFHEARHSDGHGKSLGFSHVTCPPEHSFAGLAACDQNLNGPYTIQAHFLNSLARSCQDCTQHELELIRMMSADSISRVLPAVSTSDGFDPTGKLATELRILTRTIYLCQTSQDMGWIAVNPIVSCNHLNEMKARVSQITTSHPLLAFTQSTNWDPTSEQVGSPLK